MVFSALGGFFEIENCASESEEYYAESVRLFREYGDKRALSATLAYLAHAILRQQKLEKALSLLRESLILSRDVDNKISLILSLVVHCRWNDG
jgi:hypothetical protein